MQTLQFGGAVNPQQYGGVTSGYSPSQTNDFSGMFSMMMPIIMMVMMMSILKPMMGQVSK